MSPQGGLKGAYRSAQHEGDAVSTPPAGALEHRLLVLAPIGKDADLIAAALDRDAVSCVACRDARHVVHEIERGAAALLIAEEALVEGDGGLAALLGRQQPWSDLPVLLLTQAGADSPIAVRTMQMLGNVTLLERPIRIATLISAVRSAQRARGRQYQARAMFAERDEADERKNRFLATLAHELRNPLAPIRNALYLLRLSGAGEHAGSACEVMDRQLNQMVRLVDDLLDVSRITYGKIELRKEAVDLASVIHAAVETSRPQIDGARHELAVSLPREEIVVDADPMRLAQVFANLLNNAARYTDPGGRISIAAEREADRAVVAVSDTGVGISPEALSRVFEMFAQVDGAGRRSQPGLGIGLSLARTLVEMHGGSVTVASEGRGKGSVFTVRLPLAGHARSRRDSRAAAALPPIHRPQRILVVDDNRDSANTLGALLETIGAEVRVAYDGPAALETLETFRPGAVMLDLGMPGMDGYEVARRIRARSDAADTTLIALTGWGEARDRDHTRQAGFDHHLVKPVDIATVQALLASM